MDEALKHSGALRQAGPPQRSGGPFNLTALPRDAWVLGLFYFVMHGGLLLLPDAIYWDDWSLYAMAPDVVLDTFRQVGAMFNMVGYMHVAMLATGLWTYRVLSFLLMLGAGLLLNAILGRNRLLTDQARFITVLLFLVLPMNTARVAAMNFPYALCYFLFFLGWYLMERRRRIALLAFFLCFTTNSLLMFYTLPVLDLFWRGRHWTSLRSAMAFVKSHLDFLLLPFVYFFVKVVFYAPTGRYAGYNEGYGFFRIPFVWVEWVEDLRRFSVNPVLCALFVPLAWLVLRRLHWPQQQAGAKRIGLWLLVGVLALVLGAFPYWILGYKTIFLGWTSRHQLLMPLGTALIVAALVTALSPRWRNGAMAILVGVSLSYGVANYRDFILDWSKQKAMMTLFGHEPSIAAASLVIVDDQATRLNAMQRKPGFNEWNGMMAHVFGDESRFTLSPKDVDDYCSGKLDAYFHPAYKAAAHRRSQAPRAVLARIREEPARAHRWMAKLRPVRIEMHVEPVHLDCRRADGIAAAGE